jgi:hypothetical protein
MTSDDITDSRLCALTLGVFPPPEDVLLELRRAGSKSICRHENAKDKP